ncbi:MAG: hypothetical protein AAGA48_01375 [Myxococcota bacterium]
MFSCFLALTALASPPDVTTGPLASPQEVAAINRKWRGLGFGADGGTLGRGTGYGIRLDVPFGRRAGQFFGARLRGLAVSSADPVVWMGGISLFGRGPVLLGILRVVGGGGLLVGVDAQGEPALGGGGHYGIEVRLAPRTALSVEFGSQGGRGVLDVVRGPSVRAGVMVYLGALGQGA